jgi:hypothetical protein
VVRLREPVLDAERAAHPAEGVVAAVVEAAATRVPELNAVVHQHGVDAVRHCPGEHLEERRGYEARRATVHAGEAHLARAVHRHEQVRLLPSRAQFSEADVEVADFVARELAPARACRVGQPRDALALQCAVR